MINPEEISDDLLRVFYEGFEAKRKEIGRGVIPGKNSGDSTKAGILAFLEAVGLSDLLNAHEESDGYTITPEMNNALEKIRKALGREWPTLS